MKTQTAASRATDLIAKLERAKQAIVVATNDPQSEILWVEACQHIEEIEELAQAWQDSPEFAE